MLNLVCILCFLNTTNRERSVKMTNIILTKNFLFVHKNIADGAMRFFAKYCYNNVRVNLVTKRIIFVKLFGLLVIAYLDAITTAFGQCRSECCGVKT